MSQRRVTNVANHDGTLSLSLDAASVAIPNGFDGCSSTGCFISIGLRQPQDRGLPERGRTVSQRWRGLCDLTQAAKPFSQRQEVAWLWQKGVEV